MLPPLNGFLVVNKPVGPSSAAVTNHLKWMLKQAGYPKNIKIGHGGTLDPLADGLLPVGVGAATKQLQRLLDGPKTYRFTIRWGTQTTTGDVEGEPIATSAHRPETQQITQILPKFTGTLTQTPPAYSALKVGGQRAYQLARAGQTVTLQPRAITIDAITLIENNSESCTIDATVGKGTYIRVLAEDIAQALGTVGHVTRLIRTAHGPFTLTQAHTPETLDNAIVSGQISAYILPLLAVPPAE